MNYEKTIEFWKYCLSLTDWKIELESIDPNQVMYDDEVPGCDRYFIGITRDYENKYGLITYGRPMKEEDILHELIHVKHSNFSEDEVNELCDKLLKFKYENK
jgi:hypothetical protein